MLGVFSLAKIGSVYVECGTEKLVSSIGEAVQIFLDARTGTADLQCAQKKHALQRLHFNRRVHVKMKLSLVHY